MKDVDKGFESILRKLQSLKSKTLQAGVLASAGTDSKTGTLIADYAYANEFGTEFIPARSFVGSTYDDQSKKWERKSDEIFGKILDDPSSNVNHLIAYLGEEIAGDIKEKILSNVPPPLKASTIAKKGSSRTLIDSGNLLGAINYEIVNK